MRGALVALGNHSGSAPGTWALAVGSHSKMPAFPMPALSIVDAVRIPQDVIFRELNGEGVILDLESGTYFGLDAVGTRIWQLCMVHGSLKAVWEAMQREFDAPSETLRSDLLAFVNELSTKGLLAPQS
jgi:coenzyme PQQ synthesis protein D (PqqD)